MGQSRTVLYELLQLCTVKLTVSGRGEGTGFFVAPGLILTCAHVVEGAEKQSIKVCWQNQKEIAGANVKQVSSVFDIALLCFNPPPYLDLPCVCLDKSVEPGDELYLFGYPDRDFPNGCPATFSYEGLTGDTPPLLKFKLGQVRPGMSGSPLLNTRTGKVCGMVKFTRDRSIDLGGGGIPISIILSQFEEIAQLQWQLHQKDRRWREALSETSVHSDILHNVCKKIIREQIKTIGHDKYIPEIYIERKAKQEIDTFVQFEKSFLKQGIEILDKLFNITQTDYLGEISDEYFSRAKFKIENIIGNEEALSFITELKQTFFYQDVEDTIRLIYSTIRPNFENSKFNLNVNTIVSSLKKFPFITQEIFQEFPYILSEAKRTAEIEGKAITRYDFIMKQILQVFPAQRSYDDKNRILTVKLANDLINELEHLIQLYNQRCVILVGKAGYGKTNLMCHIAEDLIQKYPTIFLSGQLAITNEYDIEFHIQRRLESEIQGISSDWLNYITDGLNIDHNWLFIMIDGINENADIPLFIRLLKNFLPKIENKRIKVILSCRDMFWDLFSSTIKPYLFEGKIININEFTLYEWQQAVEQYFQRFNITCQLDKNANLALRNPLLLRFFCEAYRESDLGKVSNIQLLSMFDLYVNRLNRDIAERFGLLGDSPVIEFLLKIGNEMWKNRITNLSLSSLGVTSEEVGKASSVYNLIRAENIIIEESWHSYVTQKTIRFVYDEFMEYTNATKILLFLL